MDEAAILPTRTWACSCSNRAKTLALSCGATGGEGWSNPSLVTILSAGAAFVVLRPRLLVDTGEATMLALQLAGEAGQAGAQVGDRLATALPRGVPAAEDPGGLVARCQALGDR